jgi:hypothetical protein
MKYHDNISLGDLDAPRPAQVMLSDINPSSATSQLNDKPQVISQFAPSDAFQAIAAQYTDIGSHQPILISTSDMSLTASIQQAMSHVGYAQDVVNAITSPVQQPPAAAPDQSSASDHTAASAPADPGVGSATVNQPMDLGVALVDFFEQTPQFEIDVVGKNFVVVDKDVSHFAQSNFGERVWSMGDGSTVAIIGIIPAGAPVAAISVAHTDVHVVHNAPQV